jgi:hypothetical protein
MRGTSFGDSVDGWGNDGMGSVVVREDGVEVGLVVRFGSRDGV